jgi:hypothetical protein
LKRVLAALLACALAATTLAQNVPNGGIQYGQVWTTNQWLNAWQSKADAASPAVTGGLSVTGSLTSAFTTGGSFTSFLSKPGITGQSIYTGICSGCTSYDANQSTLTIPVTSTTTTITGYGSYINNLAAGGNLGNGVNFFSVATCGATNSNCWGANNVLIDNTSYTTSSVTGVKLIGAEYDFDVTSTSTNVQGPNLLGSSLVQPAAAVGFSVGSLSTQNPAIAKWTYGFTTGNGVATTAINIGALAVSGTNIASQPFLQTYFDSAATVRAWQYQVSGNGSLTLTDTGSAHSFQVNDPIIAKPPSGNGTITIDNVGSQQSLLQLSDTATSKWQVGKDVSNNFFAYDNAAAALVWNMPTAGTFAFSPPVSFAKNITSKATSGTGSVTIDNAGSQQSVVLLNDNAINKWQVGKDASNTFFAYDNAAGAFVWSMPTGGTFVFTPPMSFSGTASFAAKASFSGPIVSAGTAFAVASGTGACATSSTIVAGRQAGHFTCTGATAASTATMTLPATNTAYTCWGRDITTPTTVTQTGALSTTSVTLTLTSVTANDVIQFGCLGY